MKHTLRLERDVHTDKSITGKLYLDNKFFCYTIELPWKDNQKNISCIPANTNEIKSYPIRFRPACESGKFKYDHLHVLDVTNRSYILIHRANFPKDIQGCIGVGNKRNRDSVDNSRNTLNKLMAALALKPGEQAKLIIEDKKQQKNN